MKHFRTIGNVITLLGIVVIIASLIVALDAASAQELEADARLALAGGAVVIIGRIVRALARCSGV